MNLKDAVLELLFPSRCAFCRKLLRENERGVCGRCSKTLPFVPDYGQQKKLRHISECVCPLYYEGSVRESLLRYKFGGLTAYRQVYGDFVSKCIDENHISCDIITWVPLSRRRLRKRGYDQARLIAENAAERLGIPCRSLLQKRRDNKPQSSLGGPEKRRANTKGVYCCQEPELVKGKRVLIIDDIVTTGATLTECAGVLSSAGAKEIFAAAVARGKGS